MLNLLEIKNLKVSINNKNILNNINLDIKSGKIYAIMGPNGSGKSSLALTLMGHPKYKVLNGQVLFLGQNLLNLPIEQRAKLGIFLAFQTPLIFEGVTLFDFLRQAYNSLYSGTEKELSLSKFKEFVFDKINILKINPDFLNQSLNLGLSGGEKKKIEILQIAVLQPKLLILDEIDSGLDIDALRVVCENLNEIKAQNPGISILLITHFSRILNYLKPDLVHIMQNGSITKSGDVSLAYDLEKTGYN